MSTLAPRLVLTPLLVGATSLAGRRWGPALSGWLGFGAFFLVLGRLLSETGILESFLGAALVALVIQALTLPLLGLRRSAPSTVPIR